MEGSTTFVRRWMLPKLSIAVLLAFLVSQSTLPLSTANRVLLDDEITKRTSISELLAVDNSTMLLHAPKDSTTKKDLEDDEKVEVPEEEEDEEEEKEKDEKDDDEEKDEKEKDDEDEESENEEPEEEPEAEEEDEKKVKEKEDEDEDEEKDEDEDEEPADGLVPPGVDTVAIQEQRAERVAPVPRLIHPRELRNRQPGVNFGLPHREGDYDEEIIVGGGLGWRSKVYYPNINAVVGDVLVFEYKWPFMHTVWQLPKKQCSFIKGTELASINEKMPFRYVLTKKGVFHFGCSVPGHCAGGELFSVRVRE